VLAYTTIQEDKEKIELDLEDTKKLNCFKKDCKKD